MKVSDFIIDFMHSKGTTEIFGYAGGAIIHLLDSIYKSGKVRYVTTYHEQTAAIAAEGYSWNRSGKVGVAIATSGPGATNLLTGIADAYFDSIPVVYVTGQVNTYEYKYDKKIRQQGFQETDIVSIARPVTKYAVMITDPKSIRYELEKAWHIATTGRKGPVLLDIPMDIQRADVDPAELRGYEPPVEPTPDSIDFEAIRKHLTAAQRPLVLIGGGCVQSKHLVPFLQASKMPFVYSLLGKGLVPDSLPGCQGMIGTYGIRSANVVFDNCDLVLILGSRLDTRQTGTNLESFVANGKKLIRVDVDASEIREHRLAQHQISVCRTVDAFLEELSYPSLAMPARPEWHAYIARIQEKFNLDREIERNVQNPVPYELMRKLRSLVKGPALFCSDIGHNQMFAAQALEVGEGQEFKTSGGMAPMGFSIPFSLGYSLANGGRKVISINGDGGAHIAIQSLMVLAQYRVPVKVVVMNNRSLGMITQFQNQYFDAKRFGTDGEHDYRVPEFDKLAAAYGLTYFRYDFSNDDALRDQLESPEPCVIEVFVGDQTTVFPKLEVHQPISNQNPQLTEAERAWIKP